MKTTFLTFITCLLLGMPLFSKAQQHKLYVSPEAPKNGNGSAARPLKTISQAIDKIQQLIGRQQEKSYQIILQDGTYFLEGTVDLSIQGASIHIQAQHEGKAIISAGKPLDLIWQKEDSKIWKADVPRDIQEIPALYIHEQVLTRARYPNYQEDILPFGGFGKDVLSREKIAGWQQPAGGYLHALHQGRWGGMHFEIKGKVAPDSVTLAGGWQNNRPSAPHALYRFVENIREELDAPGEWFFDNKTRTLYYYPKQGEDIKALDFVAGQLESCFHIKGEESKPIAGIKIDGIVFRHTVPTFMKTKEPLMRSDWCIYRQGALFIENASDVTIANNSFQALGGNAIFVSGHNKHIYVRDNLIENIGASGICYVGQSAALYNPIFNYSDTVPLSEIQREKGPKARLFPEDCFAEGNLIRQVGRIEKQSAGIQIQVASRIAVLHNTIHDVPRAGINIGDGAFGGHTLAYNDVFNTVLETSDHGAFNSWGRDRFWMANRQSMNKLVQNHPEIILLDAYQVTTIRNNRFHCDHGWDIDLDDGSSNYKIHDNLCLSGGIKLREGFHRNVYQNILINNTIHPHVWFKASQDTIQRNILMAAFSPVQVVDYGTAVDNNIFTAQQQLSTNQKLGVDKHGLAVPIEFASPEKLDFTVTNIGQLQDKFRNFDMDNFGVTKPALRRLAPPPPIPRLITSNLTQVDEVIRWQGYQLKNVTTIGEQSATGLPEIAGVLVVAKDSIEGRHNFGLMVNDVILGYDNEPVRTLADLLTAEAKHRWKERHQLKIWRDQAEHIQKNR